MMKRVFFAIVLAFAVCSGLEAQNIVVPDGYELVDSIVYRPAATADSALVGRSLFDYSGAEINQDAAVVSAMGRHLTANKEKSITGYRVRIFFDNKQNSRGASEEVIKRFRAGHPGVPAYRSYMYPFFKVTVGDFRTKSEAMQLLQAIVPEFPAAFVVKETINYPAIEKQDNYVTDTLHILRKIPND